METFIRAMAALNDETRVTIIAFLIRYQESCVCEFETSLGMIQSRLSRHLKILKEAGFLEVERKGTWAYYRLEPKSDLHKQLIEQICALNLELPEKINACEINKAS